MQLPRLTDARHADARVLGSVSAFSACSVEAAF
jgi:hypothetical protein